MSLPLKKRTVHFYDLCIKSSTRAAVANPSCAPLSELLKCFVATAKLPMVIKESSQQRTVLVEWAYNIRQSCYELLLSRANAALSDVALRNMQTLALRKAGKTKLDGIEVSAHVLLRPNADGRSALVLLTVGSGISIGDVEKLMRQLARIASKLKPHRQLFYFDDPSGAKDPDGMPLQYKVGYRFSGYGHKGQTLDQALQTGEFESMELIAPEHGKFDAGGNLQMSERVLKVKAALPKTVTGAAVRNAVRGFRKEPDGAMYAKLRIHYKTQAGASTSAVLAVNDMDSAFTLKEHIEFDIDVDAQDANLNPTILAGMLPLLQQVPE